MTQHIDLARSHNVISSPVYLVVKASKASFLAASNVAFLTLSESHDLSLKSLHRQALSSRIYMRQGLVREYQTRQCCESCHPTLICGPNFPDFSLLTPRGEFESVGSLTKGSWTSMVRKKCSFRGLKQPKLLRLGLRPKKLLLKLLKPRS